jgi:hypothetical protein
VNARECRCRTLPEYELPVPDAKPANRRERLGFKATEL